VVAVSAGDRTGPPSGGDGLPFPWPYELLLHRVPAPFPFGCWWDFDWDCDCCDLCFSFDPFLSSGLLVGADLLECKGGDRCGSARGLPDVNISSRGEARKLSGRGSFLALYWSP
jgi:hypothetical protein